MMNMLQIFSLLGFIGNLILVIQGNSVNRGPYMGCYKDTPYPSRAMSHCSILKKDQTIDNCIAYCKKHKFKYAGLQAGTHCYCGENNSYAKYGKVPSSQCNFRCGGNKTEFCGGALKNSVYSTEPCTGLLYENKCFILMASEYGDKYDFPQAHDLCDDMDLTLAEISNNDMYDKVYAYVHKAMIKENIEDYQDVSLGMKFEPLNNPNNEITLGNGKKIQLKEWLRYYGYPYKDQQRFSKYTHMLMRVNVDYNENFRGLLNVYSNWEAYPLCERNYESNH